MSVRNDRYRDHVQSKVRQALITALLTLESRDFDLSMIQSMLAVHRLTELVDIDKVERTIHEMTDRP